MPRDVALPGTARIRPQKVALRRHRRDFNSEGGANNGGRYTVIRPRPSQVGRASFIAKQAELAKAAEYGGLQTMERLIAEGVSADAKDGDGYPALCQAAKGGHLDALKLLRARDYERAKQLVIDWFSKPSRDTDEGYLDINLALNALESAFIQLTGKPDAKGHFFPRMRKRLEARGRLEEYVSQVRKLLRDPQARGAMPEDEVEAVQEAGFEAEPDF